MEKPVKEVKAADDVIMTGRLNHPEVVQYAYQYLNTFKRLLVDLILSFRQRDENQYFFHSLSYPEDALRIIEVGLNFIYEVFYTKAEVIHSLVGYIFQFISFASAVTALLFLYFNEKNSFDEFNVAVTYTLFLGAIALDTIALFMLIFSDWTVSALTNTSNESKLAKIKCFIASILRPIFGSEEPVVV